MVTGAENWPKEIAEVIPGAASKVITIGAKPAPKPVKVGAWLRQQFVSHVSRTQPQTEEEHQQFMLELKAADEYLRDDEFEGLAPDEFMDKLRQITRRIKDKDLRARFGLRIKQALIPLRFTLKAAWKNPPRRRPHAQNTNLLDARIGGYLWLGLDLPREEEHAREMINRYSLLQFVADYRSGVLPEKSFAIVSYETAKLGSGRVPAMMTRHVHQKYRDEHNRLQTRSVEVCACPTCGAVVVEEYDDEDGSPLADKIITPAQAVEWVGLHRRYCQAPQPRRVWDEERGKHVTLVTDEHGERYVCGAPLFEVSDLRRMPAASVAKRVKKFFGALGVDELHKCKAKGTGVGWALTVLNNACRYTVGLTGTLFGGYSTSIFWLLHRLSGEVRREFGYSDERRWVEKYGLLKNTFYVEDPKAIPEDGAYTGTREYLSVSEMPGISPAIAGIGLKYCTFSSLNDVGLPLPDYSEEIVRLDLTDAMQAQMKQADGQPDEAEGLFRWAMARKQEEDGKGAISVWLNTALNRPDAMFRGEHVVFHPRVSGRGRFAVRREESVLTLPPVVGPGEWLPKEMWTAHQCLIERDQGYKTLIGVRQTGTRDIQPRLVQALEASGLRAGILRPSLAPAKRAHVDQASRARVRRAVDQCAFGRGWLEPDHVQHSDSVRVRVVFVCALAVHAPAVSAGCVEAREVVLPSVSEHARRKRAGLARPQDAGRAVFYGDAVGGALVDELDDGDLLSDLVRKAMGKLNIGRAEGIFSIGNRPAVTPSPIGSPTLASPQLKTLAELQAVQKLLTARRLPTRRVVVPDNQLTLF